MELERLREQIREEINRSLTLPGVDEIDLETMFPAPFIEENTEFDSFEQFLSKYRETAGPENPIGPALDDFIQSHTSFGAWNNMRQQAEMKFMEDHLA